MTVPFIYPAGIEPALSPPEGDVLSIRLRVQTFTYFTLEKQIVQYKKQIVKNMIFMILLICQFF